MQKVITVTHSGYRHESRAMSPTNAEREVRHMNGATINGEPRFKEIKVVDVK